MHVCFLDAFADIGIGIDMDADGDADTYTDIEEL